MDVVGIYIYIYIAILNPPPCCPLNCNCFRGDDLPLNSTPLHTTNHHFILSVVINLDIRGGTFVVVVVVGTIAAAGG